MPPESAAGPLDLGQLPLPSASSGAGGGGFSAQSHRAAGSSDSFPKTALRWIAGHRLCSAIIAINVIAMLSSIFLPQMLVVCAYQVPIGLAIAGALFLPRFHLVERVSKAIGAQMAGIGVGGVLLLILAGLAKAGLRISRKASRNENLDFSGFDLSSLGSIAMSLIITCSVIALIIFMWKRFGIVRVIASGYLLEMSLLSMLLIVGGALRSHQDAAMDRRHDEAMARMQTHMRVPPHMESPTMPMNRPGRGGPGAASPTEIRVIVMHSIETDVEEIRSQLLERAGNPGCETKRMGRGMTEFVLQDSRAPGELAGLIDFGHVLFVNPIDRSIRVGMPR